ncbi:hypothetical protein M9Y10_038844 [Tritrichomonas musculus]|uniref:Uncharacterized protein n=1 Tax=Tritrichomonas musculus TaxID=1915356 RepID=A0ABR2KA50_9EUKA
MSFVRFLHGCAYRDIIPFLEPPNSSDQVQVLDIGMFGVQKNLKKSITTDDSLNANSNEITSIVDSWMKATLPCNVTSVFRQDCFFKEEDSIFEYIVNCDIHKVRSVRGIEYCENPLLIPAKKKKNISPTI